jgi:hypothetical protein
MDLSSCDMDRVLNFRGSGYSGCKMAASIRLRKAFVLHELALYKAARQMNHEKKGGTPSYGQVVASTRRSERQTS